MNILDFAKNNILYLDGGMGTLLQESGLRPGELPERWNISHADEIAAIHKNYFDAGSNVVCTNTFGANLLKFDRAELEKIISAAIENARRGAENSVGTQPKWVALDVGPSGRMLSPLGDLDFEEAVKVFAETVKIGAACGADLIMIETMNDLYETKAALLAAKENCNLPVFVSNAFGQDGKLMTGADPDSVVATLEGLGADAVGINCSLGPKALEGIAEKYVKCASVPVSFKPNAGLPKSENGKTVYDICPEEFADECAKVVGGGVKIVGGCCGTTPEYIKKLVEKTKNIPLKPITEKNFTVVSSYTHSVYFGQKPVLIGERINPTGKKRFKQALKENDINYILNEGISQQEKGADILDVNVGLPEIDEQKMLCTAVCELQAVVDLPLAVDTSDVCAMESVLRRYNGKPMVNSVNGKEESMKSVFPLVKKYGGVVVALTLDEEGIPTKAEDRLAIAEKILLEAEKYGIAKKNLIFDPLALTVSADSRAGVETLRAVKLITEKLGCKTSLGVSNVSFGLPERDIVNGTFFAMALQNGLSAAIMNPHSTAMMNTFYAFCTLCGMDENCGEFIEYASRLPKTTVAEVGTVKKEDGASDGNDLKSAIIKGLKEQAGDRTEEMLKSTKPLELVQNEIIPALDIVGVKYEKNKVYLPQLLMSAEAAKASFEKIKEKFSGGSASGKCPFVIATVKGDIHDIGKNIVKLLLENYGFAVTDLGRDVPPEEVAQTVIKLHAPLVGLSALMTTTVPAMEETVQLLRKDAPWCKIVVGGAVLTEEYAQKIGADKYSKDAMETVRYAEEINKTL